MTGEKLTEAQVVKAFEAARAERNVSAIDFVARPIWEEPAPHYRFEVELERTLDAREMEMLADAIDRALSLVNIEYEDRRATQRLAAVRVVMLPAGHFAHLHRQPQAKVLHLSP